MKITDDIKEITVKQRDFATAIGVTPPRVSQLIKEGIVIRNESDKSGGIYLFSSTLNYGRSKGLSGDSDDEEIDYMAEKARHEKAKREIAEIRLARIKGDVYDKRTVELVMTEQLANLRTQLLGLPTKLAPQCEGKSKEEIYTFLAREIEEKLAELSEYRPELFMEDVVDGENVDEDGE